MILLGDEARQKILEGINLVADTVKPTLGPQAKTIILQDNPPVIINDGVTITRYISSPDPYVQMGVQMVQSLAAKAQDNTGDGTTTACILAQAFCCAIDMSDIKNVHAFRKSFEQGIELLLAELDAVAKPVKDKETITQVATIAANNDEEIGRMIADVIDEVGLDAVITVEEGNSTNTDYEVIDGMEIDRGYISHLFTNNEQGKCELENPLILMTTHHISDFNDILPYLEKALAQKRPLLIVAKDVTGAALNNILVNVMQKTISVACIKAPNFGDFMYEELLDMESVVGGKVINSEIGGDLSKSDAEVCLGSATKVVIESNKTTIMGNTSDKPIKRAEILRKLKEASDDKFLISMLRQRIGKLLGGVAVIKVGAATEMEMREKKERLDDALNATQAAIQEGIVVGAGKALFNAASVLDVKKRSHRLLKDGICYPLTAIIENSQLGDKKTQAILTNIAMSNESFGFDAVTGKVGDLLHMGIIDPVKVTKSCLSTASSIALLFLTTEGAVIRQVDENAV